MHHHPRLIHSIRLVSLALLAVATIACDASINKSISVGEGESVSGGLTSVNGSIRIGDQANVSGGAQTVNGRIKVGDSAQVESLTTVNGSISIGGATQINGDVESVNGSVSTGAGTNVDGDIQTINGGVSLEGTAVTGSVETRNGSVRLTAGSSVARDVRIEGSAGNFGKGTLEILLTGGSVIEGDLIIDDKRRKVTLTIDETSSIKGEVRGGEITRAQI